MSRRRTVLLIIVGSLVVANVGLLYWRDTSAQQPQQPPSPTDVQLAVFQAKADQACRCVRKGGDGSYEGCWKGYRKAVAPFKPNGIGTLCAFEANYWDYFAPFDENGFSEKSVTISRAYGACTAEEEAKLTKGAPADEQTCG